VEGVLKAVAWLGDEAVAVHDDAYILEHTLQPRFVAYLFASPGSRKQVEHVYSDIKVVGVSKDNLARLTVPVSPPEKHGEIADAIDAVDRQIAATRAEIVTAQTGRAALLDALLSRKVVSRCLWMMRTATPWLSPTHSRVAPWSVVDALLRLWKARRSAKLRAATGSVAGPLRPEHRYHSSDETMRRAS